MNHFEFYSEADLMLRKNGATQLRFIGDGNVVYFRLPLTLWMFEKQMTGNNCLENEGKSQDEDFLRDNDYILTTIQYSIDQIGKLPLSENDFNAKLQRTGVNYLNTIDHHTLTSLILDGNEIIIKREHTSSNSQPWEVSRYSIDDICAINQAYKKCMKDSKFSIINKIYEEIAFRVNQNQ